MFRTAANPSLVVDALQHAVSSTLPRSRYRVGWDVRAVYHPLSHMPACVLDWVFLIMASLRPKPTAVAAKAKSA